MFKITGLCRGPSRCLSLPGSAMRAPCWRRDLPCLRRGVPYWRRDVPYLYLCHYAFSLSGCTVLAVDFVMDLIETTIFHLLARHLFFFSSFSLDFRRCWRNQVDNDLKSKKCFLIGIRILPGSTGVYCVDVGVTPGSAVSELVSAVLAPGCPGLYRVHTEITSGLSCRHQGLPYWHRGVPGPTLFKPGSAVFLIGTVLTSGSAVLTPGSAMFTPGWLSSRQPSTRFFPISSR